MGLELEMAPELKGLVETMERNQRWMVIPKHRIRNIETKRSYIEKSIILTLDNGQQHAFSYGPLNIDRLEKALSLKEGISNT